MRILVIALAGALSASPADAHVPDECAWEATALAGAAKEMERHNGAIRMAAEEESIGALFAGFPLYMNAVNDFATAAADFTACVGQGIE